MKKLSKFIALLLIVCAVVSSFACERGDGIDSTKTQLYVLNYNGGFGSKWIDTIVKNFEQDYADKSFESGKKGVQIIVEHDKTGGADLINKIGSSLQEVFFTGNMFYYNWTSSDLLYDITDIVTQSNPDDNGKSIESKMSEKQKNFFKTNEKYYAIPSYDSYFGINYDIDLFKEKELYYAKNGAPSESGFTGTEKFTGTGEKSAGPDGEYDTADDGLPATYDEFFALCGYMTSSQGITPFIWSGKYATFYIDYFLGALMADYEGVEQGFLNYSYNGTAKNLISVDNSGNVTKLKDTVITPSNGYEIYKTAGRYYALSFLEEIIKGGYALSSSYGSTTHIDAQSIYLKSRYNNEPIAFLIDGNWWENEAISTFEYMEKYYGEEWSHANRNFGLLPLPKATSDKIGEKSVQYSTDVALGFIKSSIKPSKAELAKTFLKYCYTDESLNVFTSISGGIIPLNYELTDDSYNALSNYQKQVWNLFKNSEVLESYSTNPIYLTDQFGFALYNTFDTKELNNACSALHDNKATAISYFNDITAKYNDAEKWNKDYSKYFN